MSHPKANVEDRQLRESVGDLADWILNHPSYTQAQLEGKILALIQEQVDRARVEELKRLLHKNVCEVVIGWSKQCEVQGETCPKIRKRIATLTKNSNDKESA